MPTSKRPIGRPRTVEGARAYGRPTKAPEKRGFQVEPMQLPLRVYAANDEEARHVGGDDAVALARKTVSVSPALWDRFQNCAAGLAGMDTVQLLDIAIRNTLDVLEAEYNGAAPFPARKRRRGENIVKAPKTQTRGKS
jgi:hypothetical protein